MVRARTASSMRVLTVLALVLAAGLAGCLAGDPPAVTPTPEGPASATPTAEAPSPDEPAPGQALEYRVLAEGAHSEMPFPMRLVITEPEEWATFWRDHEKKALSVEGGEAPAGSPPPEVDFPRERVVVVTLGEKPDSCWRVRVTDARSHEGVTHVTVTTYRPGPQQGCLDVVTQPYAMAAIPDDGTEVAYREVEIVGQPAQTRAAVSAPTPS